jgi:hypothetical protein
VAGEIGQPVTLDRSVLEQLPPGTHYNIICRTGG